MTVENRVDRAAGASLGAEPILEIVGLRKAFGGVIAVDGCSFGIGTGITGIIGPNGAGKSTVANLIAGTFSPDAGSVRLLGEDITSLPAHRRAQLGLTRTFQVARQFGSLSVLDNLLVAAPGPDDGLLGALWRRREMRRRDVALAERAMSVLDEVGLADMADERAANLSGGQMRLLEFARVLVARPKVVLFDEPTAGVNPTLVDRLNGHLRSLSRSGVSALLIEHNLEVVDEVCERVIVLAAGRVLADASMAEHRENEVVVNAYLGIRGS
jgi:ABC-type branched-subunit amino acid transport system ATPase component